MQPNDDDEDHDYKNVRQIRNIEYTFSQWPVAKINKISVLKNPSRMYFNTKLEFS